MDIFQNLQKPSHVQVVVLFPGHHVQMIYGETFCDKKGIFYLVSSDLQMFLYVVVGLMHPMVQQGQLMTVCNLFQVNISSCLYLSHT